MGYRVFRDTVGTEWQTWDVVPKITDRRIGERRVRVQITVQDERRNQETRRIHAMDRQALRNGLQDGWLCFEASDEKRRLTPIPDDWQRCPQWQLERYCTQATLARRPSDEAPVT